MPYLRRWVTRSVLLHDNRRPCHRVPSGAWMQAAEDCCCSCPCSSQSYCCSSPLLNTTSSFISRCFSVPPQRSNLQRKSPPRKKRQQYKKGLKLGLRPGRKNQAHNLQFWYDLCSKFVGTYEPQKMTQRAFLKSQHSGSEVSGTASEGVSFSNYLKKHKNGEFKPSTKLRHRQTQTSLQLNRTLSTIYGSTSKDIGLTNVQFCLHFCRRSVSSGLRQWRMIATTTFRHPMAGLLTV